MRGKREKDDATTRKERADRLKRARREAGYSSARNAAKILQIPCTTYESYERARAGFANHADKFAATFKVSVLWLLNGQGPMTHSEIAEKFEKLSLEKRVLLLNFADLLAKA